MVIAVIPNYFTIKVFITQAFLTLCDPTDCSPPVSSVHRISQARILEWEAIPYSRGLNLGLLHCKQILYCLRHQGLFWNKLNNKLVYTKTKNKDQIQKAAHHLYRSGSAAVHTQAKETVYLLFWQKISEQEDSPLSPTTVTAACLGS